MFSSSSTTLISSRVPSTEIKLPGSKSSKSSQPSWYRPLSCTLVTHDLPTGIDRIGRRPYRSTCVCCMVVIAARLTRVGMGNISENGVAR